MTRNPTAAPLALHLRRLRQWHGARGLSQGELARIAGLSPRLVRALESCHSLPRSFAALLAAAAALQVPLEALVAPAELERVRAAVEVRRHAVHDTPKIPPTPPT